MELRSASRCDIYCHYEWNVHGADPTSMPTWTHNPFPDGASVQIPGTELCRPTAQSAVVSWNRLSTVTRGLH